MSATAPRLAPWAGIRERGGYLGMSIMILLYRTAGRRACLALMHVIVGFFFLTGLPARAASKSYLRRAYAQGLLPQPPTLLTSYRHFYGFAVAGLDKFIAWSGKIPKFSLSGEANPVMRAALDSTAGAVIFTAHLGNPELTRALATLHGHRNIVVLMHSAHVRQFNRLIASASAQARVRVVEVTELNIDTATILQDAVNAGDWVVIAADRIPVSATGRVVSANFLGAPALFPQGPYILASLLRCPVYTLFCLRTKTGHHMAFGKFADQIDLPRRQRAEFLGALATQFAQQLEAALRLDPLQWYNFYDFWAARPGKDTAP